MAEIEQAIEEARKALEEKKYKDALQYCKTALQKDKRNPRILVLIGKSAIGLREYEQAELAFRRILENSVDNLAAWEGLAEVYSLSHNVQGEVEANEHLIQHTREEDTEADRLARLRLGEAYGKLKEFDKAIQQLVFVIDSEPLDSPERIELLCRLADVIMKRDEETVAEVVSAHVEDAAGKASQEQQVEAPCKTISCIELDVLAAQAVDDSEKAEKGEVSLSSVLTEIAENAPPYLKYIPYREEHLRRSILKVFHAPPRTTERVQFRLEALRECIAMICRGGATTTLPFEAAVWLLEEEEEIKGGQVSVGGQEVGGHQALAGGVQLGAEGHIGAGRDATVAYAIENFSRRMMHQFPTNPTARVLLALMLRRRATNERRPILQSERRALEHLLVGAMTEDANVDAASGFKALAELQYENRNYESACDTALRGLRWLQKRRNRGHEALTQVALGLRLVLAKSLRRRGSLDDAERHFKALAGWVTEGEAAFAEICGSAPTSIHQQALRGIALVALARGEMDHALAQYERIIGKAALGRGPAEHWAHADYGWLLHRSGDLAGARYHLEKALEVAKDCGCGVTDSQLGEHHYRLGEVYWAMKGRYRKEKQFAYSQFFEAAKVEGHAQAPGLAALGRYFEIVEQRNDAAQRCFKKALSLDPNLDMAGDALCRQLLLLGNIKSAMILCQGILSRNSSCEWASRRLGFLFLKQNNYADAITSLQTALRCNPQDSYSWEGLATAYESQGRLLAALKSFLKAIQLNYRSFYALMKTANLYVLLRQPANAVEYYRQILKLNPYYPPALIGCSKALISSAIDAIQNGSLSTAWMILDDSIELAAKCTKLEHAAHPLVSAWKMLGDSYLLKRYGYGLEAEFKKSNGIKEISEHTNTRLRSIRDARCAYSKALHLYPNSGSAWYDVACTFYHEKQLGKVCSILSNSEIDSEKLGSKTERFLVGALNLQPESAKIWASLGVGGRSFSTREYALSRALQLDPRRVVAWVSLARLYIECKEKELAKQCLDHARSQNPKVPAIWESMALLDVIFDGSKSFEFFKHAFSLGCGPDGISGFTYGSLSSFAEREGTIFAAARRLVNLQPVDPTSWNILGLISEAREDYKGAIAAYCLALQLLPEHEGRNLPSNICEQKRKVFGIKQNLTRAYIGSGNFYKAIEVLDALDTSEWRINDVIIIQTLLGVANAFIGRQCEAVACLENALSLSENDVYSLMETLQCYIQIKYSQNLDEEVFGVFEKHIRMLLEADLPSNRLAELWLTASAAAATLSVDRCIKISLQAKSWANKSGYLDAQFLSSLESLLHDSHKIYICSSETSFDPCSHLRKALYLCPWNPVLRCRLAYDLEAASKTYSNQVLNLSVSVNFGSEFRGKPSLLIAALEPALTALLSKTKKIDSSNSMKIFRQCTSSIHLYPLNKTFWCMAALLASKLASENPTVSNLQSAYMWGQRALEVISSDKSLKEMRTRVLICLSECTIYLKSYQGLEEAVQFARLALEVDDSPVSKHLALRQMGRCWWALKDFTSAEKCYQEAISLNHEELEENNMITSIELVQLLYFLKRDTELENVALNIELRFGHNEVLLKKPSFVGLIQKVFLIQVLSFIRRNKCKDAKQIGKKMEDFSRHYEGTKGLGLIAQGIATIHEAVSMASNDEQINPTLVSEARRLLNMGISYGRDSVGAHVLLALVDYYSNFRKRSERIKMHISNALKRSETPIPSLMLLVAFRLTRDKAYCARAVHTAPWLREAWSELKVM